MKRFLIILSDLLRICLLSLSKNKTIAYGSGLAKSNHILILCSNKMDMTGTDIINQIYHLFSKKPLTVLQYADKKNNKNPADVKYVTMPGKAKKFIALWHQYDILDKLGNKQFDTVIDLDPDFNLFHLCLLAHYMPSLRIGFRKVRMNRTYNLLYNFSDANEPERKLKGLIGFLKNMLSTQ
jgi:hypothetical protein